VIALPLALFPPLALLGPLALLDPLALLSPLALVLGPLALVLGPLGPQAPLVPLEAGREGNMTVLPTMGDPAVGACGGQVAGRTPSAPTA
jgi:hypothetical protein